MAVDGTLGLQENVDDFQGLGLGEVARAKGQHVGVVVLSSVLGGGLVEGHSGAHAGDLVGDHAGADAGAVYHDAASGLTARHRLRDRLGEHRVVARLRGVRANVQRAHSPGLEMTHDGLLQRESAVVAPDGYSAKGCCRHLLVVAPLGEGARDRSRRPRALARSPALTSRAP